MSEIHFYQSMSKWYFHQNVKIMLLNERWYHILLSVKHPKWFDIGGWYFLKGFKLRLKGIFELALLDEHVNDNLRNLEVNVY